MDSLELRKRFTATAVADVLRAVDGGALVGSTALALCVIDHISYLSYPAGAEKENYLRSVADYLVPINPRYVPAQIYAFRCSLVHTYAEARAMKAARIDAFQMRLREPEFHLSMPPPALAVNMDTFVADVVWATREFFDGVGGDRDVEHRAESLVGALGGMHQVAGYDAAQRYESMHPALSELDSRSPSLQQLRVAVTSHYPAVL